MDNFYLNNAVVEDGYVDEDHREPSLSGLRPMLFRLKDRVDDRLRTILLMCVRFSLSEKASGRKKLTPWTVRARKSS